jgi:signal transduction histidine kinase
MSLRTRFIALFTLLAVIPLVGVGVYSYFRSMRAVEDLVATQVEEIARNAARQVEDRYAIHRSNLLLLADNDETRRLYGALSSGDPLGLQDAMSTAEPYLDYAWQVLGTDYEWIELRDREGQVIVRLGEDYLGDAAPSADRPQAGAPQWLILRETVDGLGDEDPAGEVVAAVLPDAILPLEALETRFGASGYSTVLDRESGRVLYHPRHTFWQGTLSEVAGPDGWGVDPAFLEEPEGTFTYREADSSRVASFVGLPSPPWTVIASGSADEFGAPFARTRTGNLVLILVLALVVAGAYALLARRATRSLVALTHAADRVGAGDLSPELPEEGEDEVGRLTRAFRVMVARVRESLRQMEASRQMAAVGEFASQISHEIRNPLTSMNLNLQGLRRDVESGGIPAESSRPVEICLKEVQRLDRVVTGVLDLARPPSMDQRACSLHRAIKEALEVLQEQLEQKNIVAQTEFDAESDVVHGDPEALKSVFINLFLNSAEAMEDGGALHVSTESMEWKGARHGIRVRIADSGPGVPLEDRKEIFNPFFTTKKEGTGLGLSLAARIVEGHQGDLRLADSTEAGSGSTFVIELPLMLEEEGA